MPLTTIAFLLGFAVACAGALVNPMFGVIGYMLYYHVWPDRAWWGQPIAALGIRYPLTLAAVTAVGIVLNSGRLHLGRRVMTRHEWLIVAFLGIVWLSVVVGGPPDPLFQTEADTVPVKLTKIMIFTLMITHVVTTVRRVKVMFWAMALGLLYLGYQALFANPKAFTAYGRLNTIGGPDFADANSLALYLAAGLPILAVLFMQTRIAGKLLCTASGVLAANGFVLTRSRGGFVALAGGLMVAAVASPKEYRGKAIVGLAVVAAGIFYLTDPGFRGRVETIRANPEQLDTAASSRIEIWEGSLKMFADRPLGVGAGNFPSQIGSYSDHPRRDAHSSYVACYSELGIQGIVLFLILMAGAVRILLRVRRETRSILTPDGEFLKWASYGLLVAVCMFLFGSLTINRLYAEGLWWFVAMPVCLLRALENIQMETARSAEAAQKAARATPKAQAAVAAP